MLSHWPLRTKLKLGLGLLIITVLALFGSACYGLYAYRGLVKSLAARSAELPLAGQVSQNLVDLRDILSQAGERLELPEWRKSLSRSTHAKDEDYPWDAQWLREAYCDRFEEFTQSLDRYRHLLDQNNIDRDPRLGDDFHERQTLARIDAVVVRMGGADLSTSLEEDWLLDPSRIGMLRDAADQLRHLVAELPSHLHKQFQALSVDVRAEYRTAIVIAWTNAIIALVLLVTSIRMFYKWFAKPLQMLVLGSREVASGNYEHRIELDTKDEVGELAVAMNEMTTQFQETRDDLDRQVRERTNQVVRSEQLASVGFLAAGVSHEINNPLASIALCSESLENRLDELLDNVNPSQNEDIQVARDYLQMIQREAFRCKQITEKLLDFARRGDAQRHSADLRELTAGVIEMVQHLGKYHDKNLVLAEGDPVIVQVNAQEIKQVMLNLITNGLESLDDNGTVHVVVERQGALARIVVEDNGCGMTQEVTKHLFEPFFTKRRSGQGIGLGLSITYRIVEEHQGTIEATSEGTGHGSRFVVTLPIEFAHKENHHRYQAA
ncbi:MAG: HAMP domain-containing histidine kinase [Pirellulales bacterium]|nr:HAMP domain-containing histidine kinase [Pirellulales bacterium]